MKKLFLGAAAGIAAGLLLAWFLFAGLKPLSAGEDRHDDFIIATGPVIVDFQVIPTIDPTGEIRKKLFGNADANVLKLTQFQLDGLYLLDYRAGKLLGTVVSSHGKVGAWAEVDLVSEFGIAPRQNVHFIMTTGMVGQRSALYIAETTTGKFGVYSMAVNPQGGIVLHRLDMVLFRATTKPAEANGK